MAKEYKTLTYQDTPAGRNKMAKEIDSFAREGWTIKSKDVAPQGYDAGSTCCLGCLFLPLALLGKKNNLITVILERGGGGNFEQSEDNRRKCPLCAEMVMMEAIKCKHCGSDLPKMEVRERIVSMPMEAPKNEKDEHSIIAKQVTFVLVLKYVFVICLITFFVGLIGSFFIELTNIGRTVMAIIIFGPILYLWNKPNERSKISDWLRQNAKLVTGAVALFFLILILTSGSRGNTPPIPFVVITEPLDNITINTDKVVFSGHVNTYLPDTTLKINNRIVPIGADGTFTTKRDTLDEVNKFVIVIEEDGKTQTETRTINRTLTLEQKAKRNADNLAEQKKVEANAIATKKTEQVNWDNSSAGQLCAKHAEWNKEECNKLANGDYWVGMGSEMLIFLL